MNPYLFQSKKGNHEIIKIFVSSFLFFSLHSSYLELNACSSSYLVEIQKAAPAATSQLRINPKYMDYLVVPPVTWSLTPFSSSYLVRNLKSAPSVTSLKSINPKSGLFDFNSSYSEQNDF